MVDFRPTTKLTVLKYLRIAVTTLSLTACALLVALWVRSYRIYDALCGSIGDHGAISLDLLRGRIILSYWPQLDREWQWWHDEPDKVQIKSLNDIDHVTGFNTFTNFDGGGVLVPHWFPVTVTAIVAVIGWSRGSRRFSLRTLQIATTLIAVGLGIIVVSS